MEYLTAIELSKKWGISDRMITMHCKKGRISGAIKKGKLWLIPADAQKPNSKHKVTGNIIDIDENIAVKGSLSMRNKNELEPPDSAYYQGGIYKQLGLTRDALRYYEKIGIISPNRKSENLYREFDRYDIANFISIDFYKKRGFNLLEIKKLMEQSNHSYSSAALAQKAIELEENIYNQQSILNRLKETQKFYEYARAMDGKFEIRDFPLFSVLKSFDEKCDISNYGDAILSKLNGEDILSHLIRAVSFDRTSYKGSKVYIVKKATAECQESQEQFLESGSCIYTAGVADDFIEEKIFSIIYKWADKLGVELKGMGYYFFRSMFCVLGRENETRPLLGEKRTQEFYEIWLPIKK